MRIGRIDLDKLREVSHKYVGLTKEFVGVLVNNDRLQQEGEAQQAQATERLAALRKGDVQQQQGEAGAPEEKERTTPRTRQTRRDRSTMGVSEEAKVEVKQAAGDGGDNPDLHREGEAQPQQGEAGAPEEKERTTPRSRQTRRDRSTMGVSEEAKVEVKQAAGDGGDNPDLHREGGAQPQQGEAEKQPTTEAKAEAEAHEATADTKEREQESSE